MRLKNLKIVLFLALFLTPFAVVKAANFEANSAVYVAKDQIIAGNLYATGQTVTIDGNIAGDLIVAARTINVNGRVDGDIIAAASNITVNGEVGGNIRVLASAINLNGPVARNINAFGANVILGNNSKVGWDVLLMAAGAEVRGEIDGSLSGRANQILIAGQINKNVDLNLDRQANQSLTVSNDAIIKGDLNYTSRSAAKIANPTSISGKVNQKSPLAENKNNIATWLWRHLVAIFSAIVVGLILVFVTTKFTPHILKSIEENPGKSLLHGLIIMLVLPPIALLLMFTVIGIPLALIIGAWWLVAMYVARIITAILVGELLFQKIFKNHKPALIWSLVLGVAVLWLIIAIPFVGWIFALIAIWLGLGGAWAFVSNQLKA